MPMTPLLPEQGRIDLSELKSRIAKRLGPDRAWRYFDCLNRLLANKLSKPEFQRFCLSTLGRENIPLHNQLVLSIIKNACLAKKPPPPVPSKPVRKNSPQESHDLCPSPAPAMPMSVWSNGDILPPKKVRSGVRDRRTKDRPSPLGLNGKADVAAHQSLVPSDDHRENGMISPCDLKWPVQHHQDGSAEQPAKRLRAHKLLPHDRGFVHNKSLVEGVMEEREEVGHGSDLSSARGPLRAPLGIPFCSASVGGARRPLPLVSISSSGSFSSSYDSGELCHTEDLRRRMEKVAEAQGLAGVTMDCANILNNGLDAYLQQLIKSCVELVGARSEHNLISHTVYKEQPHGKQISGVWSGNHIRAQGSDRSLEDSSHEQKNQCSISLHDFRIAMELNPQKLGEDWPLLLEKICFRSFEE